MARLQLVVLCLALTIVNTLGSPTATLLRSKNDNNGLGNYEFWSQQSDDIYRWQEGKLQYTSDGRPYIYTTGLYAFYDYKKGVLRVVEYVADQNGYRPTFSEELIPPGQVPSRLGQGAAGG